MLKRKIKNGSMKSFHNKNLKFGGLCDRHIFLDSSMEPRIRFSTPTIDPPTTPTYYFKRIWFCSLLLI